MMIPQALPYWLSKPFSHLTSMTLRGHAFLLLGVAGLGQKTLLEHIAQNWLAIETVIEDHPDLLWVKALEGKRDITVDQIREVTQWAQQTAHGQHGRLVIIDEVERMNLAASNSLLKTLEEPPYNVRFILTASRAGKLLPTILSRCQRVILSAPDLTSSQQWLLQQLPSMKEEDISLALKLNQSAPLAAQEWLLGGGLTHWKIWQQEWQSSVNQQRFSLKLIESARKDFDLFCQQLAAQCMLNGQSLQDSAAWQLLRLVWRSEQALKQNLNKDILIDNLLVAIDQYIQHQWPTMLLVDKKGKLA